MLYTVGEDTVRELDKRSVPIDISLAYAHRSGLQHRFRQVVPFGRDTIRKFLENVSEMKKLAARDVEDILQVGY